MPLRPPAGSWISEVAPVPPAGSSPDGGRDGSAWNRDERVRCRRSLLRAGQVAVPPVPVDPQRAIGRSSPATRGPPRGRRPPRPGGHLPSAPRRPAGPPGSPAGVRWRQQEQPVPAARRRGVRPGPPPRAGGARARADRHGDPLARRVPAYGRGLAHRPARPGLRLDRPATVSPLNFHHSIARATEAERGARPPCATTCRVSGQEGRAALLRRAAPRTTVRWP
jgi:hypothetical protein